MAKKVQKTSIRPAMTQEEEQRFLYYFYEAQRLYEDKEYLRSFALFQFCYDIYPYDAMVNQYLGDMYSGYEYPHLAIPYYEKSQQYDSKNELIWPRLEQAYLAVGNYPKALQARDSIDKIAGVSIYGILSRYQIHLTAGQYKEAAIDVNNALYYDPRNPQLLLYKVQLYEVMHVKKDLMIQVYEDYLGVGNNPIILNNYAYYLATHKGDLKKAEALAQLAMQANPQNPTILDTYAWILHLQGEHTLAQLYIQQTIQAFGSQPIPDEVINHYQVIMKTKK